MSAQGMTLTILAAQLVRAYAADTAPEGEGCDIAAGLIGPNVSDWLREIAKEIAAAMAPASDHEILSAWVTDGQLHVKTMAAPVAPAGIAPGDCIWARNGHQVCPSSPVAPAKKGPK